MRRSRSGLRSSARRGRARRQGEALTASARPRARPPRTGRLGRGDVVTAWHLEAAIASRHASARTFAETDWSSVCELYDLLLRLQPSPIVALNRAIALGMAEGPEAGLRALAEITDRERLRRYPFFPAALAELEARAGHPDRAAEQLEEAVRLARNPAERALLTRKLEACRAGDRATATDTSLVGYKALARVDTDPPA